MNNLEILMIDFIVTIDILKSYCNILLTIRS